MFSMLWLEQGILYMLKRRTVFSHWQEKPVFFTTGLPEVFLHVKYKDIGENNLLFFRFFYHFKFSSFYPVRILFLLTRTVQMMMSWLIQMYLKHLREKSYLLNFSQHKISGSIVWVISPVVHYFTFQKENWRKKNHFKLLNWFIITSCLACSYRLLWKLRTWLINTFALIPFNFSNWFSVQPNGWGSRTSWSIFVAFWSGLIDFMTRLNSQDQTDQLIMIDFQLSGPGECKILLYYIWDI